MKLTYTPPAGRFVIECDVPNVRVAFETMVVLQQLFEETKCGCCQSDAICPDVRDIGGKRYYHLRCRACSALMDVEPVAAVDPNLDFLRARRHDTNGAKLPNGGWYTPPAGKFYER